MTVQLALLGAIACVFTLPAVLRRPRVHRRLRPLGAWFPAALWLAAGVVMAACVATDLRPYPVWSGLAFLAFLLAPACAATLGLAWRDARTGEWLPGVTDATATRPFGTRTPRWVRGAVVPLGAIGGLTVAMAGWHGGWAFVLMTIAFTAMCGYVAITGRVPGWLAGWA